MELTKTFKNKTFKQKTFLRYVHNVQHTSLQNIYIIFILAVIMDQETNTKQSTKPKQTIQSIPKKDNK